MTADFNREELIELYLEGALAEDAKGDFEKKYNGDPIFREEVELQKKIVKNVRKMEKDDLRNRLEAIHGKMLNNEIKISETNWLSKWSIAATVSILLLASFGIWKLTNNTPPIQSQFAYLTIDETTSTRSIGENDVPVLIISNNKEFQNHYQFTDTLTIYGDFNIEELKLSYNPLNQQLTLDTGTELFEILKSDKIQPLK